MAIATVDMKHGMTVTVDGELWEVLDKHPRSGSWWLHRWTDGVWETTHADESQMTADLETLAAPLEESEKWTQAPFNTADGRTVPATPKRQTGYVFGKWGAHKVDTWDKAWKITHLPTGLSVASRPTLPLARELLTVLQAEDFPQLHAAPFGDRPGETTKGDVSRLLALLENS